VAFIIGGQTESTPFLSHSWLDKPSIRVTDIQLRKTLWIRSIVLYVDADTPTHVVVEPDGQVSCRADLVSECFSDLLGEVSIRVKIHPNQLELTILVLDYLTRRFGIQRQIQYPFRGPLTRLLQGGADTVGIYGQRDLNGVRENPGDAIFGRLLSVGYEPFDFQAHDDLTTWAFRQRSWKLPHVDGIPGPATIAYLRKTGRPEGIYVVRI
jgi:hypothetical protein